MSELTKKLHILKNGATEEETVTLYSTEEECTEPNLKLKIDGAMAYAKLGDVTDAEASALRVYRNSDGVTYAVLKTAETLIDYWVDTEGEVHAVDASEVETLADNGFEDNVSIQNVVFPSCEIIEGITIPESTIPDGVFCRCTSLLTVELPNVVSIGRNAFLGCSALKTVTAPKATTIGYSAFFGCETLEAIELPSANALDGYVFYGCTSLRMVDAPKITKIPAYALHGCTSLETFDVQSITEIGSDAFRNCSALVLTEIPNAVSIEERAFSGCMSLKSVKIPQITRLEQATFYGCTSLETIEVPNVEGVDNIVFSGCELLKTIELPSVTSIGLTAFKESSLEKIHFAWANRTAIKALAGYASKFGATNATIYFDL